MTGPRSGRTRGATLREHILRRARSLERTTHLLSHGGELSPETLHRFHQNLRHLRVELRVWRRSTPSRPAGPAPDLDARLRRLLSLAGEVRDRDVGLAWLRSLGQVRAGRPAARVLDGMARELTRERRLGTELLRAQARIELGTRLVPELEGALGFAAKDRALRVARGLSEEATRTDQRLKRTMRAARRRPTVRRLHRFRRAVRDARTFGDLRQVLGVGHGVRWEAPIRRLHAQLGDLHDVNILYDRLSRRSDQRYVQSLLDALDRERRETHRRILRRLKVARRRRWKRYLDLD